MDRQDMLTAAEQDEIGWLIERPSERPYLSLYEQDNPPRHWTADPNQAVRFARKVDAEAMIAREQVRDGVAVEHKWVALRSRANLNDKDGGERG